MFALLVPGLSQGPPVPKGSVKGNVEDASTSQPILNALVELLEDGTQNVEASTFTDEDGDYSLRNVLVGLYDMRVSRSGFVTQVRENVAIQEKKRITEDFSLEPVPPFGSCDGYLLDSVTCLPVVAPIYVYLEPEGGYTYPQNPTGYFMKEAYPGTYTLRVVSVQSCYNEYVHPSSVVIDAGQCTHLGDIYIDQVPGSLASGIGPSYASAAWDGNSFLVFGGLGHAGIDYRNIIEYNPVTGISYVMQNAFPDGKRRTSCVWTDEYAYIFGGEYTGREVARYHSTTREVQVYTDCLPEEVWSTSAAWVEPYAYVFGGYGPYQSISSKIVRFDPSTNTAVTMNAQLPAPLAQTTAFSDGEFVYILSGRGAGSVFSYQILRYNISQDSIEVLDHVLPVPVLGDNSLWMGDHALIMGTYLSPYPLKFNPDMEGIPQLITPQPQGIQGSASYAIATDGHVIHMFGGVNDAPEVRTYVDYSSSSEKAGVDSQHLYVGGIVNVANGNLVISEQDISIPGRGFDLEFTRTYNSIRSDDLGPLGYGWTHNYNVSAVEVSYGNIILTEECGSQHLFLRNFDGTYETPPGLSHRLTKDPVTGNLFLWSLDGVKTQFDDLGRISTKTDKNGNMLHFTYEDGFLVNVTDDSGQYLNFTYNDDGRILYIYKPDGEWMKYTYNYGAYDTLDIVEYSIDGEYATWPIVSMEYYEDSSKRISHIGYLVEPTTFLGFPTAVCDVTKFVYDSAGRATQIWKSETPWCDFWEPYYDPVCKYSFDYVDLTKVEVTCSLGGVLSATLNAEGFPVFVEGPPMVDSPTCGGRSSGGVSYPGIPGNENLTLEWGEQFLMINSTDARGNTYSFEYDSYGNLIETADPLGGTVTYEYEVKDTVESVGIREFDSWMEIADWTVVNTTQGYFTLDAGRLKLANLLNVYADDPTASWNGPFEFDDTIIIELGDVDFPMDYNVKEGSYGNCMGLEIYDTSEQIRIKTRFVMDNWPGLKGWGWSDGSYEYQICGFSAGKHDAQIKLTKGNDSWEAIFDDVSYPGLGFIYGDEVDFDIGEIRIVNDLREEDDDLIWIESVSVDARKYIALLLNQTDELGRKTQHIHDSNGNGVMVIDALGNSTEFEYDDFGNVISFTDRRGSITGYGYNSQGILINVTNAMGSFVEYEVNVTTGLIEAVITALGHVAEYDYVADDLTCVVDPSGNVTVFGRNIRGDIVEIVDMSGNSTYYEVNVTGGDVDSVTNALDHTTDFFYNSMGLLTEIIDANSHTTEFAYDSFYRLKNVTLPMGQIYEYSYDSAGNLVSRQNPNGSIINYTYDALNRLKTTEYPDGTIVSRTYDAVGNLINMSRQDYWRNTTYDALNRPVQIVTSYSYIDAWLNPQTYVTVEALEYDENGNVVSSNLTDDSVTVKNVFEYDALNRPVLQTVNENMTWEYTYDADSRRASMNATAGELYPYYNTTYLYDSRGNVLNISVASNSGWIPESFEYDYDEMSRITEARDFWGTTTYGYDEIGQLVSYTENGVTTNLTYDPVGNRLAMTVGMLPPVSYVCDANDRLTSASDGSYYEYDDNGNMIYSETPAEPYGMTFDYDYENRLVDADDGEMRHGVYCYSPDGLLIRDAHRTRGGLAWAHYGYTFAADLPASAIKNDEYLSAVVYSIFMYGPGTDEFLGWLDENGPGEFSVIDGLGNTRHMYDPTDWGTVAKESQSYSPFGEMKDPLDQADKEEIWNNVPTFQGRTYDLESMTYDFRARRYDASIGRFISRDPVENHHKSAYAFVESNPVNFQDPSGMVAKRTKDTINDASSDLLLDYIVFIAAYDSPPQLDNFVDIWPPDDWRHWNTLRCWEFSVDYWLYDAEFTIYDMVYVWYGIEPETDLDALRIWQSRVNDTFAVLENGDWYVTRWLPGQPIYV